MGLFSKLLGGIIKTDKKDNARLLQLIGRYWKTPTEKVYKSVIQELMFGNSFLMFPTQNDPATVPDKWTTMEKGSTLKLACMGKVNGLVVMNVFTDEQAMLAWTKTDCQSTSMASADVLNLAGTNGVDRIIINYEQTDRMFVLDRHREEAKEHVIQEDTEVKIGTPQIPLNNSIIQKLIENFKREEVISEVYQYGQMKGDEYSIVLGFKLTTNSENERRSAINAVQNALHNEKMDQLLDLFFIDTDDWYESIRNIQNSLLYKRDS